MRALASVALVVAMLVGCSGTPSDITPNPEPMTVQVAFGGMT